MRYAVAVHPDGKWYVTVCGFVVVAAGKEPSVKEADAAALRAIDADKNERRRLRESRALIKRYTVQG